MDTTHLREQVMINQFISASGSTRDNAQNLLQKNNWNLERALSMFFNDGPHLSSNNDHLLQNTPATPDSFPDILNQFSTFKLNNAQNGNNTINTVTTSNINASNQTNDGKQNQIANHMQHLYHSFNPSSNNLVMPNMK